MIIFALMLMSRGGGTSAGGFPLRGRPCVFTFVQQPSLRGLGVFSFLGTVWSLMLAVVMWIGIKLSRCAISCQVAYLMEIVARALQPYLGVS